MIYPNLLLGFLRVGCFSFGGAYGAIPLIRDIVLSYGWLSDEELTYMIAVSESTPGPIMVNLATYIGILIFVGIWLGYRLTHPEDRFVRYEDMEFSARFAELKARR